MFNEFTVFFAVGIVVLSITMRLIFMRSEVQIGAHAAMLAGCVVGYCVILLSPGNAIRLSLFPHNADIRASIEIANIYAAEYGRYLLFLPSVRSFAILTVCFALATVQPLPRGAAARYFTFAVGLSAIGLIWGYTAYFVGAYGTGGILPLRARNEVIAVFLMVGVIAIVTLTHALAGSIRWRIPGGLSLPLIATGIWFSQPFWHETNYQLIRSEWPQLATFWHETVARDALLSGSADANVVVPRRTVTPQLLMGDELKESFSGAPNDCVARYYGKTTVVLAPLQSR